MFAAAPLKVTSSVNVDIPEITVFANVDTPATFKSVPRYKLFHLFSDVPKSLTL